MLLHPPSRPSTTTHRGARPAPSPRRPPGASFASTLGWAALFALNAPQRARLGEPTHVGAAPPCGAAPPVRILTLDGGGVRGRNLLVMAEEIERLTGRPLAEQFDLVAGTSIGGCGALFINRYPLPGAAVSAARLATAELQSRCFAASSKRRLFSEGHACADERRAFVDAICGEAAPLEGYDGPRAFALAAALGPRGALEPFLFRTYAHEAAEMEGTHAARLAEAIEATSAAPFMFPRAKLGDRSLADGGMLANDPTLIAIQEAKSLWPSRPIGLVASLGTGAASPVELCDYQDESGAYAMANGKALPEEFSAGVAREAQLRGLEVLARLDQPSASPSSPPDESVEALLGRLWSRSGRDRLEPSGEARRLALLGRRVRLARAEAAVGGYFRLQPPCDNVSPIETREAPLLRMERATREYVRRSEAAEALCRMLVAMNEQSAAAKS
ncbi:hypothetical protein AB1Y20_010320 [Prymnesium parvum]|uniref:PNPLA domain-containing protein n=1 Tax=Prymnesium parvum TaxID=97485 RepID=A0AB34K950_PRYPA